MIVEDGDPYDDSDEESMFKGVRADSENEDDPFENMFSRESNYQGGSDDEGPKRKKSTIKMHHRGTFVGTPLYVSPEMLVKSTSGPFTDLWSLGVIIFQMLTGSLPWSGGEYQMYKLIKTRQIQFPMDMSVDAIDLIDKIMQLNPLERLGFGIDGFKKIKSHKFFESIDFEKI